jgi:hypothetical protein
MSFGSDGAEFHVAHLVAFQHAIHHTVSGGDGFHDLRADDAPAVPPRTSAHSFHCHRKARMKRCARPK